MSYIRVNYQMRMIINNQDTVWIYSIGFWSIINFKNLDLGQESYPISMNNRG